MLDVWKQFKKEQGINISENSETSIMEDMNQTLSNLSFIRGASEKVNLSMTYTNLRKTKPQGAGDIHSNFDSIEKAVQRRL